MEALQIFVSYSHVDRRWFVEKKPASLAHPLASVCATPAGCCFLVRPQR